MHTVTIHTAKTKLSQIIARVEAGEEVVLARGKQPVARIVPYHPPPTKRRFGAMRGQIDVGDEILDPLPEEELAAWE